MVPQMEQEADGALSVPQELNTALVHIAVSSWGSGEGAPAAGAHKGLLQKPVAKRELLASTPASGSDTWLADGGCP